MPDTVLNIPPAIPGYPQSTQYTVKVNGQPCPAYDTRVLFELHNPNRVVAFAQFDFEGEVTIEITPVKPFTAVRVRPSRLGIEPEIDGQVIRFTLDQPRKLSVELDGGIDDNLHILASAPETGVPSPDDPNVMYYGPGIHHVDGEYGFLHVPSDTTLYLAPGSVLRARVRVENAQNVHIQGRGMIEGTTLLGRQPHYYRQFMGEPAHLKRPHLMDFNHCQNVSVEGILMNDTTAWNLNFFDCQDVLVRDLKQFGYVDNSDSIDIVSCQNVLIEDIFLRTNDDCVVLKSKGADTHHVIVRDCVLWSDRAQALQIGHECMSNAIYDVTFSNIDVLEQRNRYVGHYAIGIFNGDYANVHDILFEDIRVENSFRLIGLIIDAGFYSRSGKHGYIENVTFRNIDSGTSMNMHIVGWTPDHAVRNINFEHLTVNGQPAEPEIHANLNVFDLHFKQPDGSVKTIGSMVDPAIRFEPLDITPIANRSRQDDDGHGWLGLGPGMDMRCISAGTQTYRGVPFQLGAEKLHSVVVLRSSQHMLNQPFASYPLVINRKADHIFFLHGTAFTDSHVDVVPPEVWIGNAGKLRYNQTPTGIPLWHYRVRYADDGTEIAVPVKAGWDVEDWEIWAPGGWVVRECGRKLYIQQWNNPYPDRPIDSIRAVSALRPEVPIIVGITLGIRPDK